VLGIGLYAWSQAPWTGPIDVKASGMSATELLALVDPTTNRIDEELLDVVDN